MAGDEDLLWDAEDKSLRMVPRLRRMAVVGGCLGLLALLLWTDSDARWAGWAAVAYVLVESAYLVWDLRRLVEVRVVLGAAGDVAGLRFRRAGGGVAECDPRRVARVLVIHDNVVTSAKLRLTLRRRRLLFGRPGHPAVLTRWQESCPGAAVSNRQARWGMPGVPD